jgi:hypothetical protein
MAALWSLRGLSWRDLAKRTCRKSWEDEIFGQSARLAFYFATVQLVRTAAEAKRARLRDGDGSIVPQ